MKSMAKNHIIAAFLIGFFGLLEANVCLSYPRCYCSNKRNIKILCRNVSSLSPIEELLERYPRIYSLRIYGQNLTKLPGKSFSGKSMTVLEVTAPLSNISDDALSEVKDLQIVNFDGGRFLSVPRAFRNSSFRIVQLVGGELSRIGNQLQDNSETTDFLLNGNRISGIDPDAFSNADSLQTLNLSRNVISVLDPSVFRSLSSLKSLDLSFNQLLTLDGCFDNLNPQEILLYGNNLSDVDSAFHKSMWSVKTLDLGGNPNLNISAFTFEGKLISLSALSLNENNFENFDPRILKNFRSLRKLYLNANRLSDVPFTHFLSNPYLSVLEIALNDINSTEDLFPLDNHQPALHNLKTVRLDGNKIGPLTFGSAAKSVLHLDLGSNDIYRLGTMDLVNLTTVSTLNLSGNPLSEMVDGCFKHQLKLRTLDLSSTRLQSLNHSLQDLVGLEALRIESSLLTALEDEDLASLSGLEILAVRNNSLSSIYGALKNLSNLISLDVSKNNLMTLTSDSLPFTDKGFIGLKKLWMEGNPWSCDCRLAWLPEWLKAKTSRLEDEPTCRSPPHLNGTTLRSLNLTDLQVWREGDCPPNCDCNCFQKGSDFFTTVNCSRRGLKDIPEAFPENAREVDLSYNDIHSMEGFNPGPNWKLRILNLEGNILEQVSLSKLPKSLASLRLAGNNISRFPIEEWDGTGIESVKLSKNPWICDCEAWDFRQWLVSHNSSVADVNEVRCGREGILKGSIIIHLSFEDMCKNEKSSSIAIITVVVVLFIAACIAAYLCRKALVILCYSSGCHGLKAGEKHLYSFDAFFLYADEDEDFALGTIAEGLEAQPMGYKLFIPTRHVFLTSSSTDIESSLSDCCKVIVLLTNDFLRNAQCMQLLKSSMSCSIRNTSQRMIFVTKDDARFVSEVDSVLGSVMKNSVQLRWGTCLFWQKLKFHMPKKNGRQEVGTSEESQPFLQQGDDV